ncbi:SgrR family transcriptional regulator [Ectobacillus ponti]|uniref:SgrR family transcriptional regulator n=1 Tax=Ectobacillus ponti TaxID=2961894 RepID=A0AA42BP14_9BACI|nr:SgrR family transcriptional regulator [Ectobacillus ponti]MCP8967931.1 SgrR family transcriptional regulator [Ectobacillus ponti]
MRLLDYYLQLRLADPDQEQLQISIKELAAQLCCTGKNAKLVLKRMEEEGWLVWTRGRGRGNVSQLQFVKPLAVAADAAWELLIEQGRLEEAAALLREPFPQQIKEQLAGKLHSLFGYQSGNASRDVLRIPIRRKLTELDPASVSITAESHLLHQIFDTLVHFNEKQKTIQPQLAHYWRQEDHGTVWTFFLRKGVRFHHGRTLTAQDVVHTFRRLMDPALPVVNRWMIDEMLHVEAVSPLQVTFRLRRPNRLFLHFLATSNCAILPQDVPFAETRLIGTGPFMMKHYTGQLLVLEAFPDYFRERAHLDRIELLLLPSDALYAFDYELPAQTGSEAQTYWMEEIGCRHTAFNLRKPGPLQDLHFRRALAEIVDGELLCRELGGRRTGPAHSFFPAISRTCHASKSLEAAREHLRLSSYQGETIRISHLGFSDGLEDVLWLQERCIRVGIQVELHPFTLRDYYREELFTQTDLLLMGEVFSTDTELSFMQVFQNDSCFISRFMSDAHRKELNQLLAPLFVTDDLAEREQLMRGIELFLQREYVMLFNYHVRKTRVLPDALHGVNLNGFGWADFRSLWIEA